jgi:integrase/recombinase XerD
LAFDNGEITYYNKGYNKPLMKGHEMNEIIPTNQNQIQLTADGLKAMQRLVIDGLNSKHSKAMYGKAIKDFFEWREDVDGGTFVKAQVSAYKNHLLQEKDYAPSTVNLRLSAIRKLAREAADNGVMEPSLAQGVQNVQGVKTSGVRTGNWLTLEQAQRLIRTPDLTTLKGLRDRAILAVMIGGGLRRSEVAALKVGDIQMREARWVIVDLVGKRRRVRSVPIPAWAKAAIDEWLETANITDGKIFRSVNKGDNISGSDLTPQAVADVVKHYAEICGFDDLAAHDLRRTFAHLAREGGSELQQIQLSLGHASVKTTERYLNTEQDLTSAPCDYIRLQLA